MGFSGWLYGVTALLLGANFLRHAHAVWRDAQDAEGMSLNGDVAAKRCFKFSISYLFLLFGALVVDRLWLA
jgi:protoheme IX farnesyltransferase